MPKSVEKAFAEIIQAKLQGESDSGTKYVAKMRREGRYQQEVW